MRPCQGHHKTMQKVRLHIHLCIAFFVYSVGHRGETSLVAVGTVLAAALV